MTKGSRLRAARRQGKRCMFCEALVGSREHIWPQWMRKHTGIDCLAVNHSQTEREIILGTDPPRAIAQPYTTRLHSGTTISRKLEVVCKDNCNGGWMSRLENNVMPILAPMVDGVPRDLDPDDQRILSRWTDKTVMVMEATSPLSQTSSQADRTRVMDESNPSPAIFTQVWLGHNTARPRNAELRGHKTFTRGPVGYEGSRSDVFTAGQVLFYVLSTTIPSWAHAVPPDVRELSDKLVKIWPPTTATAHWPPASAFCTDEDIVRLRMRLSITQERQLRNESGRRHFRRGRGGSKSLARERFRDRSGATSNLPSFRNMWPQQTRDGADRTGITASCR